MEPTMYFYEGEYFCVDCAPEGSEAINSPSWGEIADMPPHGLMCTFCDKELFFGWCESLDSSNNGNGYCSDCTSSAFDSMEDRYENPRDSFDE